MDENKPAADHYARELQAQLLVLRDEKKNLLSLLEQAERERDGAVARINVYELYIKTKKDEVRALKSSNEELVKKAEYYKRIVRWYRRNRSDNKDRTHPGEPI